MEYRSPFDRIDKVKDIETISKSICKDYVLGEYLKYDVIEIGYEDFNYILTTKLGKYVVKIFNTDRDDNSCERLIKILNTLINNGIKTPKLYKVKNNYIYNITVDNTNLKLFVMEYIDGENLYVINKELYDNELEKIAKIAVQINSINYEINEIFYDEWTVTNLKEEYEKKKDYLNKYDNDNIKQVLLDFENIDFSKMQHSYIHGDIIKANLILDKNENIYVIDFSAFNYLPRIIEVAVILLGNCLTEDKCSTLIKMNCFLKHYYKFSKLSIEEQKCLPVLLRALASMYIIQTSYIKEIMGDYIENDYWLTEGRKVLKMNITDKELQFF